MNLQEAINFLKTALSGIYDSREAATISDWVLEKITSLSRIDRLMYKDRTLTASQEEQLHSYVGMLNAHQPVQYVLEEAHFYGLKFYVDENVLIPRPETEELVQWILEDAATRALSVLDIGTGSGCIAITLKSKNPQLSVDACDLSQGAISVALKNATNNRVSVKFFRCDILDADISSMLPVYDIIVSNPPYIPESGKQSMSPNVLNYEPHAALFTPRDDPFVFYRAIGQTGKTKLSGGGKLYFEIHEEGANEVIAILEALGYENIVLKNDLFGRPRMIRAQKKAR
ncbi:peptide chain release factor N(5)-glutamine methyltransferase [Flavitalea antarctica]